MLLYLVVKNHSFVDGNKRIAATLFLWFMQNNGILYRPDGSKRISDASLVALTLMIAESHTDEMDTMVKVVVSLTGKTKTFLETRAVQVRQNSLEKLRRTAEKSLEKLLWYLKSR